MWVSEPDLSLLPVSVSMSLGARVPTQHTHRVGAVAVVVAAWWSGEGVGRQERVEVWEKRQKNRHTDTSFHVTRNLPLNMRSLRITTTLALLAVATAATSEALTEAARRSVVLQVRLVPGRARPTRVFAGRCQWRDVLLPRANGVRRSN